MKTFISNWGLVFLSAALDSYAAFIVKHKFNQHGRIDYSSLSSIFNYVLTFLKSPLLLTAIIAFVCAPGLWFLALNKIDLSVGYPVLVAFHLVFILILGVGFLNEPMTTNKIIGCVLILGSLYFFFKK